MWRAFRRRRLPLHQPVWQEVEANGEIAMSFGIDRRWQGRARRSILAARAGVLRGIAVAWQWRFGPSCAASRRAGSNRRRGAGRGGPRLAPDTYRASASGSCRRPDTCMAIARAFTATTPTASSCATTAAIVPTASPAIAIATGEASAADVPLASDPTVEAAPGCQTSALHRAKRKGQPAWRLALGIFG